MASNTTETIIGAGVVAAAVGFLVYGATVADIGVGGSGYEVQAVFRKAEGLAVGGDVRIGGVKVGTVSDIALDPDTYRAILTFSIDDEVKLPEDTSAKITSASLLADNFIALEPGGSEFMLQAGDEIEFTQDSINLIDMVGKFVAGGE